MAYGKTSFVLYCDIIHVVKKLPLEKAGELFVTILEYVNDQDPKNIDFSVELVFEPIKQQLKRDLKKWEDERVERSNSGHLGGIKSGESRRKKHKKKDINNSQPIINEANEASASKMKQTKQVEASASEKKPAKQNEANEAVNVNVNVSDNDNVNTASAANNGIYNVAAVGIEKVKEVANIVWKDQLWKEQLCMGLSITAPALKKWMALFNSSVAGDTIEDFSEKRYKRMIRGWISKQQAKEITVETGIQKKSDSAPLTRL